MMRNRVDVRGVDPSSAGGAVSGSACGHRVAGGSPNANRNKWREQMRSCILWTAGDECRGGRGLAGAQEEPYEAELTLIFTLLFQSLLKHSFW